jgi:hypothetical protein
MWHAFMNEAGNQPGPQQSDVVVTLMQPVEGLGVSTLGYRVIIVADASAAVRDQDHNATFHTIYRSFGDVRPAAELIGMIESAAS